MTTVRPPQRLYRHPWAGPGSLYLSYPSGHPLLVCQLNRSTWRFAFFLSSFAWELIVGRRLVLRFGKWESA